VRTTIASDFWPLGARACATQVPPYRVHAALRSGPYDRPSDDGEYVTWRVRGGVWVWGQGGRRAEGRARSLASCQLPSRRPPPADAAPAPSLSDSQTVERDPPSRTLRTGTLSPVSMFSSTIASPASSTASHASVPGSTTMMSPGTSAGDGSREKRPSRRTSTCFRGRSRAQAVGSWAGRRARQPGPRPLRCWSATSPLAAAPRLPPPPPHTSVAK
jgi:hypothetical protein